MLISCVKSITSVSYVKSPFLGVQVSQLVPKGNYTFAVKAVDTSSNESKNATFVTATLSDPRLGDSIFYKSHNRNWGNNLPGTSAI
jgi:hypothetical protein